LDSLLSQKGPLGSGTQLRMPDDQLFNYDSADLQPSAIIQLQKLGTLIKRNPKATFAVEGFTDSLGSPDYNLELSQRRADSVKQYLVDAVGINPAQISTRGYGATRFLVAPRPVVFASNSPEEQMEIERQRPNRRVVIVVHTDAR
jgi:outer membrane protein OmpA-like peptidoglycan-associated protein